MVEWRDGDGLGSEQAQLQSIKVFDRASELRSYFRTDQEIVVAIEYLVKKPAPGMRVILALLTTTGETAFPSTSHSVSPMIHTPGLNPSPMCHSCQYLKS